MGILVLLPCIPGHQGRFPLGIVEFSHCYIPKRCLSISIATSCEKFPLMWLSLPYLFYLLYFFEFALKSWKSCELCALILHVGFFASWSLVSSLSDTDPHTPSEGYLLHPLTNPVDLCPSGKIICLVQLHGSICPNVQLHELKEDSLVHGSGQEWFVHFNDSIIDWAGH